MLVRRVIEQTVGSAITSYHIEGGRMPRRRVAPGFRRKVHAIVEKPYSALSDKESRAGELWDGLVIVVDTDGKSQRIRELQAGLADAEANPELLSMAKRTVVGVADTMVESWLLADHDALKRVFDLSEGVPHPDAMRRPKRSLRRLIKEHGSSTEAEAELYDKLACEIDLETLAMRCPDFDRLAQDIEKRIAAPGGE